MAGVRDTRILAISNSASGDTTILAAPGPASASGNVGGTGVGRIIVWQLLLEGAGAVTIQFKSGSTNIGGPIVFTAAGAYATLPDTDDPWIKTLPGQALVMNLSGAVATVGSLYYTIG